MNKIALGCLLVLVAAMVFLLWQAREREAVLAATNVAQADTLRTLTHERDTLQTKLDTACPVTLIPPQNEVQAVFEPQDEDARTKTDALKKRYEDMLVTYFVLRKCHANDVLDYHIIVSALSQEMASLQAPGRLQYDILTAAEGAYKELYSANACDPAATQPLVNGYHSFIDNVAVKFLPD